MYYLRVSAYVRIYVRIYLCMHVCAYACTYVCTLMQYIYRYIGYVYFVLLEYNIVTSIDSKFRLKVKYSSIVIDDIALCTIVRRNVSFYFSQIGNNFGQGKIFFPFFTFHGNLSIDVHE